MRWLPRLRLEFARRPWLYWLLAGVLATSAAWQVSSLHSDAVRARNAWGGTTSVWVALGDAVPGEPLAAERRDYPIAVVPRAAVRDLVGPGVAARPVSAGAVLVAADLKGDSTMPESWVVFAAPAEGAPTLAEGDGVAVFAGGQRLCDGVVAAPPGERIEFGVPAECAATVGSEAALGEVVLARALVRRG